MPLVSDKVKKFGIEGNEEKREWICMTGNGLHIMVNDCVQIDGADT